MTANEPKDLISPLQLKPKMKAQMSGRMSSIGVVTASVNSEKTRMKKCMMIMIFNLNIFFKNAKYINKVLFDRLKPSNTKAPRFYGLPKIHKPDMPLRPIVSTIGSPTYSLAKFVTKIISPLTGQTVAHVLDFRNMILKERIDES